MEQSRGARAGQQAKEAPAAAVLSLAPPVVVKETAAPANEPVAAPKPAKAAAKAKPVEEPVAEAPVVVEAEPVVQEAAKPAVVLADASPVALKAVPNGKAKVEAKAEKQK